MRRGNRKSRCPPFRTAPRPPAARPKVEAKRRRPANRTYHRTRASAPRTKPADKRSSSAPRQRRSHTMNGAPAPQDKPTHIPMLDEVLDLASALEANWPAERAAFPPGTLLNDGTEAGDPADGGEGGEP